MVGIKFNYALLNNTYHIHVVSALRIFEAFLHHDKSYTNSRSNNLVSVSVHYVLFVRYG
jgi:hypothetical protein